MDNICKYPIILVHGMFGWGDDEGINNYLPYWGATTGNLVTYLNEKGYKSFAASVGPASSTWDRACELYARLVGGVVDYGKAHSEKFNHRRYGRYYEKPLLDEWDKDNKIHIIGHSFGGNTVRLLAHLLTYGDKDEMAVTEENDLSGLFKGGQEDLIASVVTICSPHNGTRTFQVAEKFKILPVMKAVAYNYIGLAGRSPAEGTIFDFHLEQYGMSDTPGKKDAFPLRRAKKQFIHNNDNLEFDMSPEGSAKSNEYLEISPNIYYFSYSFNSVGVTATGRKHIPMKTEFPFLTFTSFLILLYDHYWYPDKSKKFDDFRFEDYANDGLVNLDSALHPADEPFTSFDPENIKPGIWNVMRTRKGDHGTPIGLFADADKTHDFYFEMFDLLKQVEEKF